MVSTRLPSDCIVSAYIFPGENRLSPVFPSRIWSGFSSLEPAGGRQADRPTTRIAATDKAA